MAGSVEIAKAVHAMKANRVVRAINSWIAGVGRCMGLGSVDELC